MAGSAAKAGAGGMAAWQRGIGGSGMAQAALAWQ